MKKNILFLIFIYICTFQIHSITNEEFYVLPYNDKYNLLFETYGFEKDFWWKLDFARWSRNLYEQPIRLKELLIDSLNSFEMVPANQSDNRFELADYLFCYYFLRSEYINDIDKNNLINIYTNKVQCYLRTYKILDSRFVLAIMTINELKSGVVTKMTLLELESSKQCYIKKGYDGVKIDYDELKSKNLLR
jgi:hypothetical protein